MAVLVGVAVLPVVDRPVVCGRLAVGLLVCCGLAGDLFTTDFPVVDGARREVAVLEDIVLEAVNLANG